MARRSTSSSRSDWSVPTTPCRSIRACPPRSSNPARPRARGSHRTPPVAECSMACPSLERGNRVKTLGVAVVASLCLAPAATAAPSPPIWSPGSIRAAILNQNVTLVGVATDSLEVAIRDRKGVTISAASCFGIGANHGGRFATFSCRISSAGPYWVRPWSASVVCVTDVSAGTCPPPLPIPHLPGDPRTCSWTTDPLNGPFSCLQGLAEIAARNGQQVANEVCVAGSVWTMYRCTWTGGAATVQFAVRNKHWTTTVS